MPDQPDTADAGANERCTALVHRAARPQAERLAGFLEGKGFTCRLRPSFDDAPAVLEEAMRSSSPAAEEAFEMPVVGRLLRFRLKKELGSASTIERELLSAASPYDVLVAPEDLERALETAEPYLRKLGGAATTATEPSVAPTVEAGTPVAVPVAHLPWSDAWELAGRLTDAGIPAAVMMPEAGHVATSSERVVPVGVKPADAERARSFLAGSGADEPGS